MVRICWGCSKSCFLDSFVLQVISEKTCIAKISEGIWKRFLYENNCNYNSNKFSDKFYFSLVYLFVETKDKNEIFSKLVIWQQEIFLFLFIASCAVLWRYAEFNRVLKKDFLTCYSCSYYCSMIKQIINKVCKFV